MARLPFDPDRIASPLPTTRPPTSRDAAGPPPLSVSQLAQLIRDVITQHVPRTVRVVGEVTNLSSRTHCFFSLKDDQATLRCVCFASNFRKVGFEVVNGMQVIATGRLDYYDAQGHLQLYVDRIEPAGQGTLEMRYRALLEELRIAGYFAPERKKPLPAMPRRVAVVTSRAAAALQDVINTAGKRWHGCQLMLMDVPVQGAEAAPRIAQALDTLARHGRSLGIEAVLLTRGGGSMEDLWAFNERVVADAIFRCPLPIVAAIGHETDTTIAELVADARCATPTQAAMLLVPEVDALRHQVSQLHRRLDLLIQRDLHHARQHLDALTRHTLFRKPHTMVQTCQTTLTQLEQRLRAALPRQVQPRQRRLDELAMRLAGSLPRRFAPAAMQMNGLESRLQAVLPRRLAAAGRRLDSLGRELDAIGPRNVLRRGYSYTLLASGQLLRHPQQVSPGQALVTVLADGRVTSRVEGEAVQAPLASGSMPAAGSPCNEGHSPTAQPPPPASSANLGTKRRGRPPKASRGTSDPGLFQ